MRNEVWKNLESVGKCFMSSGIEAEAKRHNTISSV